MRNIATGISLLFIIVFAFTMGVGLANKAHQKEMDAKNAEVMQYKLELDTASKELFYCKYPEQR